MYLALNSCRRVGYKTSVVGRPCRVLIYVQTWSKVNIKRKSELCLVCGVAGCILFGKQNKNNAVEVVCTTAADATTEKDYSFPETLTPLNIM